ncbi:M50 family metallopeptidase [Zongyangia hominis]|uniref:M50 family metallopeptidase n=1 Tax=Zongyangia hominis TaxID=2763677 RepID=A0A926EBX7_9FIRM|nr:M50 family metallopeptidase [Zongyangia hominis]MBC8569539.1 M50 family metallopeptidase [Zongyangia hominis]
MLTFRICNTQIRLSIWFFAVLYLFLIMDTQRLYPLFFGSIFLHEGGHLLMMKLCGKKVDAISFMPFGIQVRCEDTVEQSYGREIAITLAGPFLNLLCAGVCFLLAGDATAGTLALLAAVNLTLGVFNLLPIGVLDGGRLLHEILQMRGVERQESIAAAVSFLFLAPLLFLALWLFLTQGHNPTLLITGIYLTATAIFKLRQ